MGKLSPGRSAALFLLAAAVSLTVGGCASSPTMETGFYLDTVVRLTVYDGDQDDVHAAMEAVRRYDALFSPTREDSDISRLNAAAGQAVTVDPETAALIRRGLEISALSGGAFDPTVAPVTALWDFRAGGSLPEESALAQAASRVDYRRVRVEEDAPVVRLEEGATLDLGGIAKGYIADRVRALLLDRGVTSALIDLGGNIYAVGSKNGGNWIVGVRDPAAALEDAEANELAAKLPVRDTSVVTSGVYERGFYVDGVLYHHLLDPATGRPARSGLLSVTIICGDSTLADGLSTACFVLGPEKGMALAESLEGVEALFIDEGGSLTATSGLQYEM